MTRTRLTVTVCTALLLLGSADASRRSTSSSSASTSSRSSSTSVSRSSTPRSTGSTPSTPKPAAPKPVVSTPAARPAAVSGGAMGGRAVPRTAPASGTKAAPMTRAVPKTSLKPKVKVSDCDADDLAEGDVQDCGVAALPAVVAGAAATGVAVAGAPAVTTNGAELADAQVVSAVQNTEQRPNILLWVLLTVGTLALFAALVLAGRRGGRRH
ncbi:hypothetical protein [Deinococcus ficus]|uniref:hypothetical protein n=1 Tax=Deinococcus ficus TaxID=317577 RepID=UPI0012DFD042|nr:hypothetical protein [Deinococcus ficus]